MSRRKVSPATVRVPHPDAAYDLAVACVRIESLKPNPRNARTHSRKQIQALAASLEKFKFTKPIITDGDGNIVTGHGCLAAAKYLGLTEVPVIRRTDLSKEQLRHYALADNKLAENSGWDSALLAIELKELGELGANLSLTGFEFGGIDSMLDDVSTN